MHPHKGNKPDKSVLATSLLQQQTRHSKLKEESDSPEITTPKSRRKKDAVKNDFVCGCGKGYGSYPALYVHIRSKHEGRAPAGTIRKDTRKTNSKRGRPRKDDSKTFPRENEEEEHRLKMLLNIVTFIGEKGRQSIGSEEIDVSMKNKYIRDVDDIPVDFVANFPDASYFKGEKIISARNILLRSIKDRASRYGDPFENLDEYIEQLERQEDSLVMSAIKKEESEDQSFGGDESMSNTPRAFMSDLMEERAKNALEMIVEFTLEIGRYATVDFYKELCIFSTLLIATLRVKGVDVIIEKRGEVIVERCDDLIDNVAEYVHEMKQVDDMKHHWSAKATNRMLMIGESEYTKRVLIMFTVNFVGWLYMQKYSDIILEPIVETNSNDEDE